MANILRVTIVLGATLAATANPSQAEPQGNVPAPAAYTQLVNCKGVVDNAARLACYDQAVDTLSRTTESGETIVIDKAQVRQVKRGLFGFSVPQVGFLEPRDKSAADIKSEQSLTSKVVSALSLIHI